ncbi:MAG TPA: hypothetical protein VJ743_10015 [Albitalea sp.]|nr:hypothetical protein [Albitalea sp.]
MNPLVGWGLAALLVAAGWQAYAWHGVALAVTAIAFWLVLQFNRTLRVMRDAAQTPLGYVDSAVMLNARLRRGMTMLQIVKLTGSLGRRLPDVQAWSWSDAGGATVTAVLAGARLDHWQLLRAGEDAARPS